MTALVTESSPMTTESSSNDPQLRIRYRIRFAKTGLLRWISHRDLARLWERLLRRAHLTLSMTEGFHPKPRVSFPSALALGVDGLDEVVEIELTQHWAPEKLLDHLRSDDQPGLTIKSVCLLPEGFGKAQLLRSEYTISFPDDESGSGLQDAITALLQQDTVSVTRKSKTLTVAVAEQILLLKADTNTLNLALAASDSASLRPGDVLDLLGLNDWIERGARISRTQVVLQRELVSDDPEVMAGQRHTQSEQPEDNE